MTWEPVDTHHFWALVHEYWRRARAGETTSGIYACDETYIDIVIDANSLELFTPVLASDHGEEVESRLRDLGNAIRAKFQTHCHNGTHSVQNDTLLRVTIGKQDVLIEWCDDSEAVSLCW